MHYIIHALVPKNITGENPTLDYIDYLMEPFNENSDDPRYIEQVQEEYDGEIETYARNPNGHWDWHRPGGRWDGWIVGNPQSSGNGFNFGPIHETVQNNRIAIAEHLGSHMPAHPLFSFGLVYMGNNAPKWIDRYLPGWGQKPDQEWQSEYLDIVEPFRDTHDIVLLDVHS